MDSSTNGIFAVFYFLFSFFLVYHTVAQNNERVATEVNMNCRCNSIGFKIVNIIWEPLPQDANSHFKTVYYKAFYCTSLPCSDSLADGQYQLGCTLNTTHQSLEQKELQCTIRAQTLFRFWFYFILEMRNSSGGFIRSRRKSCRLISNVKCTKPHNLRVQASGKRKLSVSWEPARDMEPQTPLLWYKIWYASEQSKANESVNITSKLKGETILSHTIDGLNPHTKYTFFIQCSLPDCSNNYCWGALTGPVIAMTKEEVPAEAPKFENWSASNIDGNKRNVTVFWKLPPSNTWNGVLKKFEINYWQVSLQQNDSLTPISNSSRTIPISNGSTRKAILPGLNRFVDYESEISMCTSEGCGPKSKPWVFQAEIRDKETNKARNSDTSADSVPWRIIAVGVAVGIFIFIAIAVACNYTRKLRRRRRDRRPLNEILSVDPPRLYDDPDDSILDTQNSYAEIRHERDEIVLFHQSSQAEQDSGGSDT